jgi:hypothetical protein
VAAADARMTTTAAASSGMLDIGGASKVATDSQ